MNTALPSEPTTLSQTPSCLVSGMAITSGRLRDKSFIRSLSSRCFRVSTPIESLDEPVTVIMTTTGAAQETRGSFSSFKYSPTVNYLPLYWHTIMELLFSSGEFFICGHKNDSCRLMCVFIKSRLFFFRKCLQKFEAGVVAVYDFRIPPTPLKIRIDVMFDSMDRSNTYGKAVELFHHFPLHKGDNMEPIVPWNPMPLSPG